MEDTPYSSRPKLYIQDSSDEDLPEQDTSGRRNSNRPHQAKGKLGKPRVEGRHLIKQEVSPGSSAPRHFKGVRQLLEKPAKQHVESVEESESDDEQLADTQLIPPSALPRALKFRNDAASAVTPLPNTGQGFKPSFKTNAFGSNRMLFEAREQDMVEEDVADDDASASAKKQRVNETTPAPQRRHVLADADNPASAHRSFLASNLANLANVPSSARRMTPKKGGLLGKDIATSELYRHNVFFGNYVRHAISLSPL